MLSKGKNSVISALVRGLVFSRVQLLTSLRRQYEGGSTIVLLFEKGVLEWDEDLLINGRASLETLVRVGMGIGRGLRGGVQNGIGA